MIREAIDRILELAEAHILEPEEDGRKYSDRALRPILPPSPGALTVSTLSGIVDWLESEGKNLQKSSPALVELAIHIAGPAEVIVHGMLDERWLERNFYVVATACPCAFPFGQPLDIEQFIINLQLNFVDTPAKAAILKFISHISQNEVRTADDDGLSQTTVVKNEIGMMEAEGITPIQKLQPFRTFREVDQPEAEFLLRLTKGRGDSLPLITLYAASGLAWEIEAVANIYSYLDGVLPETKIIR